MSEALIASIFTGGITLAVCLINNYFQRNRMECQYKSQHEETMSLIEYKLDELTKRVDEHNNIVIRTYGLEKEVALHSQELSTIVERMNGLES